MKVLTLSSLYPNRIQPGKGVFIENRTRHLYESSEVKIRVVAPIPWFPFRGRLFGRYAKFADIPRHDFCGGLSIDYPRYVAIPKIGMSMAPMLMALGLINPLRKILADDFDFDLIDAYYFYPDGVAAALLAAWFHKPVVINALGTDVNVLPAFTMPRAWIKWAANRAAAITTVSSALKQELLTLSVDPKKVYVNLHGVDHSRFSPGPVPRNRDRYSSRDSGTLLCVGNLLEAKGQHIVIEALLDLPTFKLIIVGEGDYEAKLKKLASELNVADRVNFVGQLNHEELTSYYVHSDALILPSLREGIPNVILEALACGTPVIATNIGGIPEIIKSDRVGRLLSERSAPAIADAVKQLFSDYPSATEIVEFSKQFTWAQTTKTQLAIFRKAILASYN